MFRSRHQGTNCHCRASCHAAKCSHHAPAPVASSTANFSSDHGSDGNSNCLSNHRPLAATPQNPGRGQGAGVWCGGSGNLAGSSPRDAGTQGCHDSLFRAQAAAVAKSRGGPRARQQQRHRQHGMHANVCSMGRAQYFLEVIHCHRPEGLRGLTDLIILAPPIVQCGMACMWHGVLGASPAGRA